MEIREDGERAGNAADGLFFETPSNMFPFIINQGPFVIPTFFFMVMTGVLVATFYLYFRAPKMGFSQVVVLDAGILGSIFGILGARLYHVAFESTGFYREDPMRIFEFWRGGFASYGAFAGGALAVIIYLRLRKLPILKYADFATLCLPIIVFFVRLGCLGAGCCFGKPTDWFFHLTFSNKGSDAGVHFLNTPLYPTQIFDQINAVIVFVVLHLRYAHKRFGGEIMLLFFILYPTFRMIVEYFRGDVERGMYFHGTISRGQITGALVIFVCLVLYAVFWKKSKKKIV